VRSSVTTTLRPTTQSFEASNYSDHRLGWRRARDDQEEIAFLAWQWVPLVPTDLKEHVGCDPRIDEGARLRLLLDSYGYTSRLGLIDAVIERVEVSRSGIEERAAAGDPPYVALRDEGYTRGMERTIHYLIERRGWLHSEIE
jgi:hypothetical protein